MVRHYIVLDVSILLDPLLLEVEIYWWTAMSNVEWCLVGVHPFGYPFLLNSLRLLSISVARLIYVFTLFRLCSLSCHPITSLLGHVRDLISSCLLWLTFQIQQPRLWVIPACRQAGRMVYGGRGSQTRTDDLAIPNRALYQTELYPETLVLYPSFFVFRLKVLSAQGVTLQRSHLVIFID